jgi:hypothetical protein
MINPKIQCIMRYLDRIGYHEIANYLIDSKFIPATDAAGAIHPQERAELIYNALSKAAAEEKLLLLDFEWKILPLEQIKIICISTREEKQFTYGF